MKRGMKTSNLKKRIQTSLILLFLILLIIKFDFILLYSIIIVGSLSIIEFFNLSKKIFKNNFYQFISNSFFTTYLVLFCLLYFYFSQFFQLKIIIFTLLFGCIASDIGGYVLGKTFKGPKLTKISPNKTISGFLGAVLFTNLIIFSIFFYYTSSFNLNIFFISLFTSLACQSGDLFFSFLKRKAKLKDTGNILPGHGGILDRIDGILLGIPIGMLSLIIFF